MSQAEQQRNFLSHSVNVQKRSDGTMLLESDYELGDYARNSGEWLHSWAEAASERVFIAERSGAGWREESYLSTLQKVQNIASSLLARGMGPDTPILILSGNSIDHALLALAAQYIGAPVAPLAEQYSLIQAAHSRLVYAAKLVKPRIAYVDDADEYAAAIALDVFEGVEIVASKNCGNAPVTSFDTLLKGDSNVDLQATYSEIGGDTVAKILMTSGSTSEPKGVLTTQRMMCVNQAQIAQALPFLRSKPPRLLDWLPWNHVFGGSHNFNMILANGGTLYIDNGKPVAGLFERTLDNLSYMSSTLSFNVPVGYALLEKALTTDRTQRQRFFENLDLIFYAGATLPEDVWKSLERMALEIKGEIPLMTSSWGLTETAPAVTMQSEPIDRPGVVGVPLAGTSVKLIPESGERFEVRVKGPNTMTGYFHDPEKTADAFDDEGFFITGDAMKFVDANDASRGLRFVGRLSEDFKLLTGTWVRTAQVRLDMLASLTPLAADLIVVGADRAEIGIMVFPNNAEMKRAGYEIDSGSDAVSDPDLLAELKKRMVAQVHSDTGSSSRVARAIVLAKPAALAEGEITAKGNLNFRKVLARRGDMLVRLYDNDDSAVVRI